MKTLKAIGLLIGTLILTPILMIAILLISNSHAAIQYASNEIIVKYKNVSLGALLMTQSKNKLKIHKAFPEFRMMAYEVTESLETTLAELQSDPSVEFAEPNYIITASKLGIQTTALPETASEAPSILDMTAMAGSTDPILVAVVDTGVDYTHVALKNRMWTNEKEIPNNKIDDDGNGYTDDIYGWNFAYDLADPIDDHGHGTHVAGTISGIKSPTEFDTAGNFKIMALKFLDEGGSGTLVDAISAISYGLQMGAKVFNNSWGGSGFSQALHDIITQTYNQGTLFVAAAGNDGSDNDQYPAYPASYAHPNLLAVAASDDFGKMAWFSNYGLEGVDVAAPGVGIYSSLPGDQYGYMSGTSMATPYATRVAMLMMDANRSLSIFQIKKIMMETVTETTELKAKILSGGIIDDKTAIEAALKATPDGIIPTYTPTMLAGTDFGDSDDTVSMGPAGCGIISGSGPSGWNFTNTLSLFFIIIALFAIQLPARAYARRL